MVGQLWTTKDGVKIAVHDMQTDHIQNALLYITRILEEGPPEFPSFHGEMDQAEAESAFFDAADRYDVATEWRDVLQREVERRQKEV